MATQPSLFREPPPPFISDALAAPDLPAVEQMRISETDHSALRAGMALIDIAIAEKAIDEAAVGGRGRFWKDLAEVSRGRGFAEQIIALKRKTERAERRLRPEEYDRRMRAIRAAFSMENALLDARRAARPGVTGAAARRREAIIEAVGEVERFGPGWRRLKMLKIATMPQPLLGHNPKQARDAMYRDAAARVWHGKGMASMGVEPVGNTGSGRAQFMRIDRALSPPSPPTPKRSAPKKKPKRRSTVQTPKVTQNAVQSVRDAFRYIDLAGPKLANPRGYGLTEAQWRRLAGRVDEMAHALQPLICSTMVSKIDRTARRARKAVTGARMPARKAVR